MVGLGIHVSEWREFLEQGHLLLVNYGEEERMARYYLTDTQVQRLDLECHTLFAFYASKRGQGPYCAFWAYDMG